MADFEDLKGICLYCGSTLKDMGTDVYGLHQSCFRRAFEMQDDDTNEKITGVAKLMTRARAGSAEEENDDSVRDAQFHGNYPKYTVTIANATYIAKLGKTNDYNLIALAETITNKIAVLLGINVPTFCLIFWKNRPCFVVKNFISGGTPSNLVHLENLWPKGADGRMTEYFLPELMSIVKKQAGYRAEVQIVQLVIFDYLIGNADRHRGNIAFIQDKNGIRLAPIYDNVSELGLEQEDFLSADDKAHPAMRILVEGATKVDSKTYLKALKDLGYEQEVFDFCKKLKKEIGFILDAIDKAFYLTPNLKASFKDLVHRRYQEIIEASEELK